MSTSNVNAPGFTNPTKPSPTSNTKPNRLPAPTLFVGPPSRNASQISVSRQGADPTSKSKRPDLTRQRSTRTRGYTADGAPTGGADGAADSSSVKNVPILEKPSEKSIDAKWREMQSTLNEVELTAQSSTHVFGESHAKALDELRNAQVALAKAWGRGNENNDVAAAMQDDMDDLNVSRFKSADDMAAERERQHNTRPRADTQASGSTVLSDESGVSQDSARSGRSQLEDETAMDIKLAGERRAANEAYFKKVDQGVKEVVERLEKVAEAMRGVEGESRSLWSQSDTTGSGSSGRVEAEGRKRSIDAVSAGG